MLVFKNWYCTGKGLPDYLVSDRDAKFVAKVWVELCKQVGVVQAMSTARHQKTDGLAEFGVKMLKRVLIKYSSIVGDWSDRLAVVEFSLNNSVSSVTGFSPFYLAFGYLPKDLAIEKDVYETGSLLDRLIGNLRIARNAIMEAQIGQSQQADKKSRAGDCFRVGDKVMLYGEGITWPAYEAPRSRNLTPKWLGPFEVVPFDGESPKIASDWTGLNYRLKLPVELARIFPVFHVGLLRRYRDPESCFPGRPKFERPSPVIIDGNEFFELETILGKRIYRRKIQYLVQWKGYGLHEATWLDWVDSWKEDQHFVDAYEKELMAKGSVKVNTVSKVLVSSLLGAEVVTVLSDSGSLIASYQA
jgi:hypothetical protein